MLYCRIKLLIGEVGIVPQPNKMQHLYEKERKKKSESSLIQKTNIAKHTDFPSVCAVALPICITILAIQAIPLKPQQIQRHRCFDSLI